MTHSTASKGHRGVENADYEFACLSLQVIGIHPHIHAGTGKIRNTETSSVWPMTAFY